MAAAVLSPVQLLVPSRCRLGEGPLWDQPRQTLFWSDIDGGELYAWHQPSGKSRCVYRGDPVGGFTLEADGAFALFRVGDIARFDPESGEIRPRPFADSGMKRFNDVTADFHGRVFAGTIGRDEASGGLHRLDPDGSSRLLFRGTGVANGMGFSLDRRTFYWTDSTARKIFAFDYDPASGDLSGRRVFYACGPDEGAPDGLCVDREGHLWSARWGGARVVRHAPADGRIVESLAVPASCVTSCCFGGPGNSTLFVTSARPADEPEASLAGGLWAAPTATGGQAPRPSRLFSATAPAA